MEELVVHPRLSPGSSMCEKSAKGDAGNRTNTRNANRSSRSTPLLTAFTPPAAPHHGTRSKRP